MAFLFVVLLIRFVFNWLHKATTCRTDSSTEKPDVRQQQMEINGQEILTKDKAALRINA